MVAMLADVAKSEAQTYDLKFLVDFHTKVYNLVEQIEDNINYNIRYHRNLEDLEYQNDWNDEVERMREKLLSHISKEVENHPVWEWASQLNGIRGDLLGLIVGSIRFWPPKINVTSQDSGRERWAHSVGALLTFCGLNSGKQYHNNSQILKYIRDQVFILIKEGNSYHAPYQKFIEMQRESYKNSTLELDTMDKKIKEQAVYNMCILFMKHIYLVIKNENAEEMSLLCSPEDLVKTGF